MGEPYSHDHNCRVPEDHSLTSFCTDLKCALLNNTSHCILLHIHNITIEDFEKVVDNAVQKVSSSEKVKQVDESKSLRW
jgi:hypothetical protein